MSRAVFFAFAGKGVPLLELSLRKASLEDVFLELTEADTAGAEGLGPEDTDDGTNIGEEADEQ